MLSKPLVIYGGGGGEGEQQLRGAGSVAAPVSSFSFFPVASGSTGAVRISHLCLGVQFPASSLHRAWQASP